MGRGLSSCIHLRSVDHSHVAVHSAQRLFRLCSDVRHLSHLLAVASRLWFGLQVHSKGDWSIPNRDCRVDKQRGRCVLCIFVHTFFRVLYGSVHSLEHFFAGYDYRGLFR